MDDKSHLIQHYIQLEAEIDQFSQTNTKLLIATIAATGTILTYGFTHNSPVNVYIFFCTFLFILPISNMVIANRKNIWRISTYLRVFIEPEFKHIKWESRLIKQRALVKADASKLKRLSKYVKNEIYIFSMLSFVAILSTILMHFRHFSGLCFEDLTATILALFGFLIFLYVAFSNHKAAKELERTGPIEQDFYESWLAIKMSEKKHKDK